MAAHDKDAALAAFNRARPVAAAAQSAPGGIQQFSLVIALTLQRHGLKR